MVVQHSVSVLENIGTGISSFIPVPVLELKPRSPLVEILIKLGLIETLYVKLKPRSARALRHALRRVDAAGQSYSEMRSWLIRYRETSQPGSPNYLAFFRALNAAENCLLHFHVAIESIKALAGDGGIEDNSQLFDRISLIANSFKHSDGQAKAKAQKSGTTNLPVFFKNEGISNGSIHVSFFELHERYETTADWITEFSLGFSELNPLDPIMSFRYNESPER